MGRRNRACFPLVASLLGLSLMSCGSESGTLGAPTPSVLEQSVGGEQGAPSTEFSTVPVSVDSAEERFTVEVNGSLITLALPSDARPDPVHAAPSGGSVLAAERWMTDCCWLSIVTQNQRPLFAESMRIGAIDIGQMNWELYDLSKEGFSAFEAVTTTNEFSASISAQVRFPEETPNESARDLVRSVVETIEIVPE